MLILKNSLCDWECKQYFRVSLTHWELCYAKRPVFCILQIKQCLNSCLTFGQNRWFLSAETQHWTNMRQNSRLKTLQKKQSCSETDRQTDRPWRHSSRAPRSLAESWDHYGNRLKSMDCSVSTDHSCSLWYTAVATSAGSTQTQTPVLVPLSNSSETETRQGYCR